MEMTSATFGRLGCLALIALLVVLKPAKATAEPLTKQQLIEMSKAHLSDDLIVNQIQKEGISFEASTAVLLELRKAGLSNDVLKVLVRQKSMPVSPPIPPSPPVSADELSRTAKDLYTRGEYAKLVDNLKTSLEVSPNAVRSRSLLVLAYLKLNKDSDAVAEFDRLRQSVIPKRDVRLVEGVKALIDKVQAQQEIKRNFIERLNALQRTEAEDLLSKIQSSDEERAILTVYLDVFSAKFDDARLQLNKLGGLPGKQKTDLSSYIETASKGYSDAQLKIADYLYSDLTPSLCSGYFHLMDNEFPKFSRWSLEDYRKQVSTITEIAPLSDSSMDLAFHAELLASTYESLEALGDKVLNAKGTIRIPGASSTTFYSLIIDKRDQKLYTEVDPHRFQVLYTPRGVPVIRAYIHPDTGDAKKSAVNSELEAVNIRFQDIKSIEQHVGGQAWMVNKPYVLKFNPKGQVPDYALMRYLYCVGGPKAELSASQNLGKYILHVIGRSDISASLAKPEEAYKGDNGNADAMLLGMTQVYGTMAAQRGSALDKAIAPIATQAVQQSITEHQADALVQKERAAWYQAIEAQSFDWLNTDAFKTVEVALNSGTEPSATQ